MTELLVFQILTSAATGTTCAREMLTVSTALVAIAVNVLLALSCHPMVPALVRNEMDFLSCLYLTNGMRVFPSASFIFCYLVHSAALLYSPISQ